MIAVASILYGSVMAFTQTSATLVVGYSSIAQLGLHHARDLLPHRRGRPGRADADGQPRPRGGAALLHHRRCWPRASGGTDDLRRMGGLAMRAPVLAALFLVVTLATLAIPGSANFVGEFLILNGTFNAKIVYAIVAGAGVVLAAVYCIRLYQRSMHNPLAPRARSRAI